jgi:integrase
MSNRDAPAHHPCITGAGQGREAREAEVCGLRWEWERKIDGAPSVFVLPPDCHKGGDYENYRLVVLNSVARAIVEARRDKHATHIFSSPRTKQPMTEINKNAYTRARREAGLQQCRLHDLKHTFGARLKAAGIAHELRQVLLGHKNESVTTHYSRARIDELQEAVEKVALGRRIDERDSRDWQCSNFGESRNIPAE